MRKNSAKNNSVLQQSIPNENAALKFAFYINNNQLIPRQCVHWQKFLRIFGNINSKFASNAKFLTCTQFGIIFFFYSTHFEIWTFNNVLNYTNVNQLTVYCSDCTYNTAVISKSKLHIESDLLHCHASMYGNRGNSISFKVSPPFMIKDENYVY